jgi:hypothetical protein
MNYAIKKNVEYVRKIKPRQWVGVLLYQTNKITGWHKRKQFFTVSSCYHCDDRAAYPPIETP